MRAAFAVPIAVVGLLLLAAAFPPSPTPASMTPASSGELRAAGADLPAVSGSLSRRDPSAQPARPPLALPGGDVPVTGGIEPGRLSALQSGDRPRQAFWAWDFHEARFYELSATEVHPSNRLRIYVEDGLELPSPLLRRLAIAFEDEIYPRLRAAYGTDPQPGVDDDPAVTILLLDIRDALYHRQSATSYVAGYFDPTNEKPQDPNGDKRSNEREMIYVDVGGPTELTGDAVLQTSAHEFSHLILWNHDADEEPWTTEGLAELGIFLAGLGHPKSHILPYLARPNSSLTYWDGEARDYGKVYLFMLYLYDHFEREEPGWLRRLVAHPADGMDGLRAVLPPGVGPAQVFRDQALALFVNDPSLAGGRFAFASIDLGGAYPLAHANPNDPDARGESDFMLGPWSARGDRWIVAKQGMAVRVDASVPGSLCVGAVWAPAAAPGHRAPASVDTDCLASAANAAWTFAAPLDPEDDPTLALTLIANVTDRPRGGIVTAAAALPQNLVQRVFLPFGLRRR